ncbi:MAG: hypothetical protein AAFP26_08115 [Planctomycetota bacterium]
MTQVPVGGVDPMEPVGGGGGFGGDGGGGGEASALGGGAVSAERLLETRAQEAERRAAELEARVAELEGELASAVASCEAAERRREIDRSLVEAGTIDLEAAALLAEAELSRMAEPDSAVAVDELRRSRPYLFSPGERGGARSGVGRLAGASCEAAERRREIDRSLVEAGTIDLEAAALLAEAELSRMAEPDSAVAVDELRRSRPYLFSPGERGGARSGVGRLAGATTSAATGEAGDARASAAALGGLADEARLSGDRRALLRYLRQRRGG